MRSETTTRVLYKFNELSERAKERARDWFREGALDYDWWEYIYEDANTIGLKITEFDLDRSRHAKGILGVSVVECCARIIANHGPTCDTYLLAARTFKERQNGSTIDRDEFERELLEEYSVMLQAEYEYRLSDEAIDEDITANEYEFTVEGKRA